MEHELPMGRDFSLLEVDGGTSNHCMESHVYFFSLYKGRSLHLASAGAITFTVVSIE